MSGPAGERENIVNITLLPGPETTVNVTFVLVPGSKHHSKRKVCWHQAPKPDSETTVNVMLGTRLTKA